MNRISTGKGLDRLGFSIVLTAVIFCSHRCSENESDREHEMAMANMDMDYVCGCDEDEDTDTDSMVLMDECFVVWDGTEQTSIGE